MNPAEIVNTWLALHRAGDLGAARRLLAPSASIMIGDIELRGFDELSSWYANRESDAGPGFTVQKVDTMTSDTHVTVLSMMTDGSRSWRQLAFYEVDGVRITAIWVVESDVSGSQFG